MSFVIADRVRETTLTTGTGTVTLAGAYTGFQTFSAGIGNGNSTYYAIANVAAGQWEVGIGTYTSGANTLSRATVLASSNAGSLVNFTNTPNDVFVTQPAERALYVSSGGTGLTSGVAAFTANGVAYASSTTGLATGSSLVFDGTHLGSPAVVSPTIGAASGSALSLQSNGTTNATLDTSGNFGINTGNLNFSGSSQRITGDFSNGTVANRVMFQTSTANTSTILGVLPSGTGIEGRLTLLNNSNPTLSSGFDLRSLTTEAMLRANSYGGGYLPMTFYTGGSEMMRLDTSGNLGIGTSSPDAASRITSVATSTQVGFASYNAGTAGYPAFGFVGQVTSNGGRGAGMYLPADGTLAWSTAGSERMRIDSSGNVGIGTSSPSTYGKFVVLNSAATSTTQYANSNIWAISNASNADSNIVISNGVDHSAKIGIYNGANLYFSQDGVETMRINSSGNVGIGTSSPSTKLEVSSANNIIKSTGSSGYAAFYVNAATGNASYCFFGVNGTESARIFSDSTNYIAFGTGSSSTEKMRIDSSGNVGIGTNSPSAPCDVVTNAGAGAGVRVRQPSGNATSAILQFVDYGVTKQIGALAVDNNGNMVFGAGSSGTERMRIDSSGNLLVGTTNKTAGSTAGSFIFLGPSDSGAPGFFSFYRNDNYATNYAGTIYSNWGATGRLVFAIQTQGNVLNYNNSYGALSDASLKENIVDATPKLTDLLNVRVRNYNMIGDTNKQIGVVAQELETVFPTMVDTDKEGIKSVKYSVFVPMLIKAIQELNTTITAQATTITTMQSQITDLQAKLKTAGVAGF